MSERMKILIGYDGSECADAALEDLRRAGLPERVEAVVLSVADVFVPPPVSEADDTFPFYVPPGVKRAHEHAARVLGEARILAERTASRVGESFPGWDVRAEASADSPGWALVSKAYEWRPDLIVVGAQGHTNLGGRLILGSVSQRVLHEAPCSVRVARGGMRKEANVPVRMVVGVDGSPGAEATVAAVAARAWPAGSEVRLVSVLDTFMWVKSEPQEPSALRWVDAENEQDWEYVRATFEPTLERLRASGLTATIELRKGNPKQSLITEAEDWDADCIFVGAKGMRGIEPLLIGSVSAAVAARAHCSVEVVRGPNSAESGT
jgi:nucleotide-binding universal stress UspA family protein